MDDFVVKISRSQAYRARRLALEMIDSSHQKLFRRMWDYVEELLRTNLGSTIQLLTDTRDGPSSQLVFQRFYACLHAIKSGFRARCSPLIGVNGCHLKGPSGMQLLAAVGRDGNNQMYPVAYTVVEVETKETWIWFLRLLFGNIGSPNHHKHLHSNFSKLHKGKQLKDAMRDATRATIVVDWTKEMKKIKNIDKAAYTYLMALQPHWWTRTRCNGQVAAKKGKGNALATRSIDVGSNISGNVQQASGSTSVRSRVNAIKYTIYLAWKAMHSSKLFTGGPKSNTHKGKGFRAEMKKVNIVLDYADGDNSALRHGLGFAVVTGRPTELIEASCGVW
ncbi:hypothetical protein L1049_014664 [Liquidambar formosana]|uniref:MULE transposase domain-containing protein n=1 Tax=Liquidambar formosana TaxID=63359 RepID=A0AAP0RW94_LIQFO